MNNSNIKITKGTGEQVAFDAQKLSTALKRSGAHPNEIS